MDAKSAFLIIFMGMNRNVKIIIFVGVLPLILFLINFLIPVTTKDIQNWLPYIGAFYGASSLILNALNTSHSKRQNEKIFDLEKDKADRSLINAKTIALNEYVILKHKLEKLEYEFLDGDRYQNLTHEIEKFESRYIKDLDSANFEEKFSILKWLLFDLSETNLQPALAEMRIENKQTNNYVLQEKYQEKYNATREEMQEASEIESNFFEYASDCAAIIRDELGIYT